MDKIGLISYKFWVILLKESGEEEAALLCCIRAGVCWGWSLLPYSQQRGPGGPDLLTWWCRNCHGRGFWGNLQETDHHVSQLWKKGQPLAPWGGLLGWGLLPLSPTRTADSQPSVFLTAAEHGLHLHIQGTKTSPCLSKSEVTALHP